MDKVSIIVPILNAEKYLRKCLDSLINQTYKNIEIILINDGSTDNTKEILFEYKKKHPKIIKVINQVNQGIGASRNTGLKISKGKYVGFADSDDYLEHDMYEKMLNVLVSSKADIAVCDYYQFNSTKRDIVSVGKNINFNCTLLDNPELINGIDYAPWNKVYKKELFDGIEFPVRVKYEDMNTILKVFDKAKKIIKVNEPLYNYLINETGETCSINKKDFDSIIIIKDIINYFSKYKDNKDFWLEIEKLSAHKLYYTLTSTMNLNDKKLSRKFVKEMIPLLNKNFPGWKNRQLKKYSLPRRIIVSNSVLYSLWITFRNPKLINSTKSYIRKLKNKNTVMKKVMFISSVGGHLTQILELKDIFKEYKYVLVTEKTDVTKTMKENYNIEYLPYGSRNQKFAYLFILLWSCIKSLFYFLKYNPQVIITTGANTAAAMCCLGKIFGKKVIYIESFAKRTSSTVTGKYIYKFHAYTTFVVQWESMLKFYPKAEYWGGIY